MYFPHIDGLRAIAVLSVLFFHMDIEWLSGGYIGVDIFFVISGFLITKIIVAEIERNNNFSFVKFYKRRIRRLAPAYLAVIALTTLIASLILSPALLKSFGGAATTSLFSVSNIYFWLETDYFDVSSHFKPLLHTWSLSVEEQFYMFWPITLLILLNTFQRNWVYLCLALLFSASLSANLVFADGQVPSITRTFPALKQLIENGQSTIFYLLPFRVFEFICGSVLVFMPSVRLMQNWIANILILVGLALVAFSIYSFDQFTVFPSVNALVPCIGTMLLIRYGHLGTLQIIYNNTVFVKIGLFSYSLYLVHWPIIVFWKYLQVVPQLTFLSVIAITALSILLGFLSYRFIELPFREPQQGIKVIKHPRIFLGAFIATAIVGLSMHMNQGWSWRIPDTENWTTSTKSLNFKTQYYGGEGYPRYGPIAPYKNATIIVIGDSHGLHYAEGLNKVLSKEGVNSFISAGTSCLHLPNFTRKMLSQDYDQACPHAFNKALQAIEKNKDIKLVIIAQRWKLQIPQSQILHDNSDKNFGNSQFQNVAEGFRVLKEKVGKIPLLIVCQLPETNELNIHELINRPLLSTFGINTLNQIRHTNVSSDALQVNQFLKRVASENPNIEFVDPTEYLCSNKKCRNFDDENELLYSDSHHLSKAGSIYLIQAFKQKILHILNTTDKQAKMTVNTGE